MILLLALTAGALQAGGVAAHLATGGPAPVRSTAAAPLSFEGAVLGMTLGAWKSLSPPPGVGPTAAADCGPGVVAALRANRIAAATPDAGEATCAYDARFGDAVLLHSAKLDDHDRIEALRYRFTDGRLSEIDFTASVDAYNDIVARLTHDYGPPSRTDRGSVRTSVRRFAQVQKTWSAAGGVVTLTDPTDNPLRLSVRIAGASAP
jgi:hypothetical protein